MAQNQKLITFAALGLLGYWLYTQRSSDTGGGYYSAGNYTPSLTRSPPVSEDRAIIYPGLAQTSSRSSGGGYTSRSAYVADYINPRGIPADVATNPARLIKDVLPGGSGGVISGLIQSSQKKAGITPAPSNMLRIAQPGATKANISAKVDRVLTPWWAK